MLIPLQTDIVGQESPKDKLGRRLLFFGAKQGSIFRAGSVERFLDFPVDPSWIQGMVEFRKMVYEDAKGELVQCGKGPRSKARRFGGLA